MVLVSNEWQNKCEDVPKTTANTTTTAGTNTTTTAPTTSSGASTVKPSESIPAAATSTKINTKASQNTSETVAGKDFINSATAATDAIISTLTIATGTTAIINNTLANDNSNIEQINEIIKDKNSIEIVHKNKINEDDDINDSKVAEVGKLFTSATQQQKDEDSLEASVINCNNSIKKMMAENSKESPSKEEKQEKEQVDEVDEEDEEELQAQDLINNDHIEENNKYLDETNSHQQNSNTNTLTASQITIKTLLYNRQRHINRQQPQQQEQVPLAYNITTQALSRSLQSSLNATNNANNANNSVAAAGLQPNFLSQFALAGNLSGLQKSSTTTTAEQLNQSFNILDPNNQNKSSDSNLLLEGVTSTTTTSIPAITTYESNGQAKIVLICEGNSHPFQVRTISLTPNVECMVGRLIAKSKASENNAIFDCKVLSRKHAVIWYTPDGKFWVKDTKSSNGTFINDNKLGDDDSELHFGDIVKFGVDVLENSRKEVHGCIIACVKLYLPDGREAISIDSSSHRSQFLGEGRISYDELNRLNLYIQETSQREKVLTSKLCNIQNVLDATRKNSALCWQSMITEDQLLHRIHSLEKKLQFMEKNVPENILRNEVLKLLDDKNSYQHTAKEALRKVYQERCEAMQMLAKMETAYTQSANECSLLRDQIMSCKQTLQDVNTQLLRLETEYNEYKDEMAHQQQEAKDREEQHISVLTEKLRERELECEDLKRKISELLVKRAGLLEDEEQLLEKQAIEKLDAAIADMDLGDDDDSDEENSDEEIDVERSENKLVLVNEEKAKEETDVIKRQGQEQERENKFAIKKPFLGDDQFNIFEETKFKKAKAFGTPPKRVKENTIMKWLQNSDINKNEGSFDIFKAICNENENDDDESGEVCAEQLLKNTEYMQIADSFTTNENKLFSNFTNKLKNVQKNLKQLETEIEIETSAKKKFEKVKEESSDDEYGDDADGDDVKEGARAEEEFIIKSNGTTCTSFDDNQVLWKENTKYLLLKTSVNMLREAYNEIWDSVKEQEETRQKSEKESTASDVDAAKKHFQIPRKFVDDSKTKLRSSESDNNTESDSEVESFTLSSSVNSSPTATVVNVKDTNATTINDPQQFILKDYQSQVLALNEKLQQTQMEAQHTLEIMQVECDDVRLKMENLNKIIEVLKNEKKALEKIVNGYQNNAPTFETSSSTNSSSVLNDAHLEKEFELEEDPILNAINVTELEREEELITYKERLEVQQRENIDLRNEIVLLKQKTGARTTTKDLLLKQYLPYSVIVLAIIIYFLTSYY